MNDSIGWITERLGVSPTFEYTGGDRGWIGDNPFIFLDTARIRALGWTPTLSIREGVLRTLDYLQANPAMLETAGVKVAVLGLWHLGSVTAACLASAGHVGDGVRSGTAHRSRLWQAASRRSPSLGLAELIATRSPVWRSAIHARICRRPFAMPTWSGSRSTRRLTTTTSRTWRYVERHVEPRFPYLADGAVVLCSSQLPVGTMRKLEQALDERGCRQDRSPSRARRRISGSARRSRCSRIPIASSSACATNGLARRVQALLAPITDRIEWMSVESAEMTKHAINAFLATSVAFINELAALCERAGADAKEVERGLRTERRIGPHAYLSPGGAFAGGTLARDVAFLRELGASVWPADAADRRRAREQHGARHVGAAPAGVGAGRRLRERRSRSGA